MSALERAIDALEEIYVDLLKSGGDFNGSAALIVARAQGDLESLAREDREN